MTSAVDWLMSKFEFRAKFKFPHSYDHLVSTSGQCDASIKKNSFVRFLRTLIPSNRP